jgi:hypothetical protein
LVVNLTTRFEGCGPAEKKFVRLRSRHVCDTGDDVDRSDVLLPKKKSDSGYATRSDTDTTSTWLPVSPEKRSLPAQNQSFPARFVDKLLNIHRIECAKLAPGATADFLSSFDPIQKQGLFSGLRHT